MELRDISITPIELTKLTQTTNTEVTKTIEKREVEENALSKDTINHHITTLNTYLEPTKTSLKFQLHDKLNEYYVQIIDTQTDEVIKEIPSKKFLDRYAATTELLGFMVDQKI
ncbi:flagellar protein FlaG [Alkalihalobacillus hwajinpoensis]|uniref:flagellar protein FlaG n=1 Tax=Guptibacillus hwajinpoensis TaxID=208199 RepID=UPI001883E847|nr:flagellar protein FlaG [Pseudalkalibacillus hwajinpoensis]MBF0705140.1 flagellar protein FlaG [Pseudalkalibacillus hwajinpoensis]